MRIQHFYDAETGTLTYVLFDELTRDCVVIDPVLNYDLSAGLVTETSLTVLRDFLQTHGLSPRAILETHAHADHLSGAQVLKASYPTASVLIGEGIKVVQASFKGPLQLSELATDASQFDETLQDQSERSFGSLRLRALATPGHTPACMSYLFGYALFTGDAIFMPDAGTGRCDFPGGSARELYHSITRRLYTLPDQTRLFVGHDYRPLGRELKFETTVGESKRTNIHLNEATTEAAFVEFREARDKTLKEPRLMRPSLTVNLAGGRLAPGMHRARS